MTVIENNNPRVQYIGPYKIGDTLPLTFPYMNEVDIRCKFDEEEKVLNVDYEVELSNVIIKVPVLNGTKITLYRDTPLDQQAEFPQTQKFNSEKMNEALDKFCMQQQEQAEAINRAIKVTNTNLAFNTSMPAPDAGKAIIFNKEGTGLTTSKNNADDIIDAAAKSAEEARKSAEGAKTSELSAKASAEFAAGKVDGFDANVAEKTKQFNDNAQGLTDGFNQNAMLKIDDFDAHAMEKEIAFDDNVSRKTSIFNNNASIKQAQVDASAAAAKQSENNAKNSENVAGISEDNARESERKSRVWTEGTDQEVSDLGGKHSAKKWAEIAEGAVAGEGLVTIDTDQEIIGHKTFTADIGSKSNDLDIRVDRNKRGSGLIFIDKNGTQTAGIGPYVNNNGSPEVRLIASNGTQSAFAGLGTTKDGQGFFWGPEPAEGANNEDYVTSHWVQRELTKNYVAKKGDTMTGALKFGTSGYIEANKANSTKGLAVFGSIDGYAQGASLALRDNTADGVQAGVFKLETGNNVTGHTHTLQGNPDGSVFWDNKELVCFEVLEETKIDIPTVSPISGTTYEVIE